MKGGAIVSAVALLVGTAGVAAAGTVLPGSDEEFGNGAKVIAAQSVSPAAGATTLGCPGPPRLSGGLADDADQPETDSQFEAAPVETRSAGWLLAPAKQTRSLSVADLRSDGKDAKWRGVDSPGSGSQVFTATMDADTPAGVRAVPSGAGSVAVGGLVASVTGQGDLRGLAASACTVPAADTWLVGGGTDVGHGARLVLDNPGRTPATVDVEIVTEEGTQAPAAGRGVVVPAGQRREVLLEGLVAGERAIAVHVRADGGRVAAFLHDSLLRGLVPGGVDVVAPSAAPSTRQLVPGVLNDGTTRSSLRIVNPGSSAAVVSWRLLGDDGQRVDAEHAAVTVPARSLVDVELAALPEGSFTAVLESESKVVASALLQRGTVAGGRIDTSGPVDFGWSPSVGSLSDDPAVIPLPRGERATGRLLMLGGVDAADGRSARVQIRAVDSSGRIGEPREVEVPSGRSVRLEGDDLAPQGARGVLLTANVRDVVPASLVLWSGTRGSLVSVTPVNPAPAPPDDVVVRAAVPGTWP